VAALTVAAVGDIMMGTDYPQNILPDDDGVSFLSGVTHILSAADVAFGNLEGVLMEEGEPVKRCAPPRPAKASAKAFAQQNKSQGTAARQTAGSATPVSLPASDETASAARAGTPAPAPDNKEPPADAAVVRESAGEEAQSSQTLQASTSNQAPTSTQESRPADNPTSAQDSASAGLSTPIQASIPALTSTPTEASARSVTSTPNEAPASASTPARDSIPDQVSIPSQASTQPETSTSLQLSAPTQALTSTEITTPTLVSEPIQDRMSAQPSTPAEVPTSTGTSTPLEPTAPAQASTPSLAQSASADSDPTTRPSPSQASTTPSRESSAQAPVTSGSCYVFRSPTRYAAYLREAGFDVMSLANNHAQDFGDPGRDSSMQALSAVGIRHSGREGDVAEWEVKGRRVALVAFAPNVGSHQLNDLVRAQQVVAELAARNDIVIVSFHGGAEGEGASKLPFTREIYYGEDRGDVVEFAHAVIDAGADLVLGHGPHVLRPLELYRDRLIAYSLGNFATYYGISVSGIRGIAGVLVARLTDDGRFLDGHFESTVQIRPAGPSVDPAGRGAALLRELTAEAFPQGQLNIEPDGRISRKSPLPPVDSGSLAAHGAH
jgi:hypothetical protein